MATETINKTTKGAELPGMPPKTDLVNFCERWIEQKEKVEHEHTTLDQIAERIVKEFEKPGSPLMVKVGGREFERDVKAPRLKVTKVK